VQNTTEKEREKKIVRKTGSFLNWGLILLASLVWTSVAFAEVQVRSLVDRNELAVGENFALEVQISSEESVDVGAPSLPTIPGVEMINTSTHNESRSSVVATGQGIDFKTVRTTVHRYEFRAQTEGKIQIDPIRVQADGKTLQTQPIQLNVLAAGSAPTQAQRRQQRPRSRSGSQGRMDDVFRQMEEQFDNALRRHFGGGGAAQGSRPRANAPGGFSTPPKGSNHAFFILAEVDKTEAYKGEQIVATWYLYTQGTVRDIDTLKYPTLKGFWKEDIQISTHLNFQNEVVNGIPYNRALLASYALFPIEEGKAKIDSYKAKATILRGFGFSRGSTQTKASDMIPIFVKPLPVEGRPADYTGAVGKFQMKADVSEKSVVENQPFSVKLRFDGRGNAKLIELPALNLPQELELYDKSNESQFFKNGQSFKEFTILMIPRKSGEVTIPSFKSSFFDPETQAYVELATEPIVLNVLKGAKALSMGEERIESEGGSAPAKTLPGIALDFDPNTKAGRGPWWPWPVAIVVLILLLTLRSGYELGWFDREPDLRDDIKKRFVTIRSSLGKNDHRALGIEVTNTVYHVLGEVSGQGGANIELSKLMTKLPPSVRREIEAPLKSLMDFFGLLGFGPKKVLEDESLLKNSKKNVKAIEDLLLKSVKLSRGTENNDDS